MGALLYFFAWSPVELTPSPMGVPAFYAWLVKKYPKVISDAKEAQKHAADGSAIPVNINDPNPNGTEYDALYLDMNGIIHPCAHPEGKEAPPTEDHMMIAVFEYLDRLMDVVRPRKLLFMAVDGVAPRAKMNQQRARRFAAAKEGAADAHRKAAIKEELERLGYPIPAGLTKTRWDHNVITPGTPFMHRLAKALHWYAVNRIHGRAGWEGLTVILSDANVPGEGEHKIMEYIRLARLLPDYDANQSHILCGLDADLIMLALSTHEVNFTILREHVPVGGRQTGPKKCFRCGQTGHDLLECDGLAAALKQSSASAVAAMDKKDDEDNGVGTDTVDPFTLLHLPILREYLDAEFRQAFTQSLPFAYDLDRVIDDWVFMAFFVGNDFLPHLPSMDIREGALDRIVQLYKRVLPTQSGYLTSAGDIHMERVAALMDQLKDSEAAIFRERAEKERRQAQRKGHRLDRAVRDRVTKKQAQGLPLTARERAWVDKHPEFSERPAEAATSGTTAPNSNMTAAALLKRKLGSRDELKPLGRNKRGAQAAASTSTTATTTATTTDDNTDGDANPKGDGEDASGPPAKKRARTDDGTADTTEEPSDPVTEAVEAEIAKQAEAKSAVKIDPNIFDLDDDAPRTEGAAGVIVKQLLFDAREGDTTVDEPPEDEVRLHEDGYEHRYWKAKFGVNVDEDPSFPSKVAAAYVEGLVWVLKYYYHGVQSWGWFYPYHYAPFAANLTQAHKLELRPLEMGKPYMPVEQLMAVLPAASAHALPDQLAAMMRDPNSVISDFYPTDFKFDLNGKRHTWQAVVLLPFIDEQRLQDTVKETIASHPLTAHEEERNRLGHNYVFTGPETPLARAILGLEAMGNDGTGKEVKLRITYERNGLGGAIGPWAEGPSIGQEFPSLLTHLGQEPVIGTQAIGSVYYFPPTPDNPADFKAFVLPSAKILPAQLTSGDIARVQEGRQHEYHSGRTPYGYDRGQNRATYDSMHMNAAWRAGGGRGGGGRGGGGRGGGGRGGRGGWGGPAPGQHQHAGWAYQPPPQAPHGVGGFNQGLPPPQGGWYGPPQPSQGPYPGYGGAPPQTPGYYPPPGGGYQQQAPYGGFQQGPPPQQTPYGGGPPGAYAPGYGAQAPPPMPYQPQPHQGAMYAPQANAGGWGGGWQGGGGVQQQQQHYPPAQQQQQQQGANGHQTQVQAPPRGSWGSGTWGST